MQNLKVDTSKDPINPDILLVPQCRTANDPWLPRLKSFECLEITEALIPFIPLFLSPQTTNINIRFKGTPTLVVASAINRVSSLCPNLGSITINPLPRDSMVTEAASEMLLACNRDTLKTFCVDSPLTEEAREVVYQLPRLSTLWTVIQASISLPTVALPNLTVIDVEYDDDAGWLRGFHGATLKKLKTTVFRFPSKSGEIGDFVGAFESVALAASAQNTLSEFLFFTPRSWNPKYSSLLSFNQLMKVEIQFSCDERGCSSTIDDDMIVSLARAMPKLQMLRLGTLPCATPTGVTVDGLIGLARLCPQLSRLRIHFQVASLVEATTTAASLSPSDGPLVRQQDCALTHLEVGRIPITEQSSSLAVTLVLLRIFPRLLHVVYTYVGWRQVAGNITNFSRLGTFVHHSGKPHPPYTYLTIPTDPSPGDKFDRNPLGDGKE